MKIVVIGLGSMGRRRIRLLQKYDSTMQIWGVDLLQSRCSDTSLEYHIPTCTNIDEIIEKEKVDCAFITTSPITHGKLINKCLEMGLHVFTELNLVPTNYDCNIKLAQNKNKIVFQSSTFLYRKEIQYIKKMIKVQSNSLRYQYHVGQYLPDWHPWESYKDFFVANTETNACREIMAIELPWITQVFGNIAEFHVEKGKISSLDISYPDYYIIYIKHDTGHEGILFIDIVSRVAQRLLNIVGEELFITWNGQPSGLQVYDINTNSLRNVSLYQTVDKLNNYCSNIIEDAYYSEIVEFFDTISNKYNPRYTYEMDKEILSLIDRIEGVL